MSLINLASVNKLMGGYSAAAAARVSSRCARPVLAEKCGADRLPVQIVAGFGVLDSVRVALGNLTHFCGFAGIDAAAVCPDQFVCASKGRRIASFLGQGRLIGNLRRAASFDAVGVGLARPATVRGWGSPPATGARCTDILSRSCDLKFSKKFTAETRLCLIQRIASCWLQPSIRKLREIQVAATGSGVRVAREVALTGRLARHRHEFSMLRVRVQRAFSLALGLTGMGKLCPQNHYVN